MKQSLWRSFGLISLFLGGFGLLGWAVGGIPGLLGFLITGLIVGLVFRMYGDRILLRSLHAQAVGPCEFKNLFGRVQILSNRMGIPTPAVAIIPYRHPNILTLGRSPHQSTIVVTLGALESFTDEEMNGVLGHALARIRSGGVWMEGMAALLARVFLYAIPSNTRRSRPTWPQLISYFLFAPLAASVVRLALRSDREYTADAEGVQMLGSSKGLTSALLKIESAMERDPMPVSDALSHLFVFPPSNRSKSILRLFRIPVSVESRIERLQRLQISLALKA